MAFHSNESEPSPFLSVKVCVNICGFHNSLVDMNFLFQIRPQVFIRVQIKILRFYSIAPVPIFVMCWKPLFDYTIKMTSVVIRWSSVGLKYSGPHNVVLALLPHSKMAFDSIPGKGHSVWSCMFSLFICGFSLGSPAFSHWPKTCMTLGVGVSELFVSVWPCNVLATCTPPLVQWQLGYDPESQV